MKELKWLSDSVATFVWFRAQAMRQRRLHSSWKIDAYLYPSFHSHTTQQGLELVMLPQWLPSRQLGEGQILGWQSSMLPISPGEQKLDPHMQIRRVWELIPCFPFAALSPMPIQASGRRITGSRNTVSLISVKMMSLPTWQALDLNLTALRPLSQVSPNQRHQWILWLHRSAYYLSPADLAYYTGILFIGNKFNSKVCRMAPPPLQSSDYHLWDFPRTPRSVWTPRSLLAYGPGQSLLLMMCWRPRSHLVGSLINCPIFQSSCCLLFSFHTNCIQIL